MPGTQLASVQHLLQLQQRGYFVPTDVADIIGTGTPQRRGGRLLELLDMYFIRSGIVIVLHPKHRRSKQVIVIGQLRIPNGMDLFAATNGFVGAQCVNWFEKVG